MPSESYLLDTSVATAAWYQRDPRHYAVRDWLKKAGGDTVFISAVSIAESEYGLNIGTADSEVRRQVREARDSFRVLDIDRHTAKIYGAIRGCLFVSYAPRNSRNRIGSRYAEDLRERTPGKKLGIQENDLWIVSVAVRYNMVLVTADRRGRHAQGLLRRRNMGIALSTGCPDRFIAAVSLFGCQ